MTLRRTMSPEILLESHARPCVLLGSMSTHQHSLVGRALTTTLLLLSLTLSGFAAPAAEAGKKSFDIPAGDAPAADWPSSLRLVK